MRAPASPPNQKSPMLLCLDLDFCFFRGNLDLWRLETPAAVSCVLGWLLNVPEQCMARLGGARVFVRQIRHAHVNSPCTCLACVFSSFSQVRVHVHSFCFLFFASTNDRRLINQLAYDPRILASYIIG
jgi:hypothetical protein